MVESACLAEVLLWGRRVAGAVETDDGQVVFEYDPKFRRSGLEISPRHLPLTVEGPLTFPELSRLEAFEGLPGVLADSLPDRFGNAIIEKYFAERGRTGERLGPVQKLLYIGSRGMGALEYRPAEKIPRRQREDDALEAASLVEAARRVVEGDTEVAIPEIMRLGSSAGGARAKAIILWNPEAEQVRSAFAPRQPGDEEWLIKFDGVGEIGNPDPKPRAFNRIEYAYSRMAVAAGIEMAETRLMEERSFAHFMTRRFDRTDSGGRLHYHSLGGMEHIDYNVPGLYSYEQYFRLVLSLGLGYPALEQAFRRACFNLLAVNQDDHVKNFSFLMDDTGRWRLSPAYDLTFVRGRNFTRDHQLSLGGKRNGFTRGDLIESGAKFDLRFDGRNIIDEIAGSLHRWPEFAREAGVSDDTTKKIFEQFRVR